MNDTSALTTTSSPRRRTLASRVALGLAGVAAIAGAHGAGPVHATTGDTAHITADLNPQAASHATTLSLRDGSRVYTGQLSGPLSVTIDANGTRTYTARATGTVSSGADAIAVVQDLVIVVPSSVGGNTTYAQYFSVRQPTRSLPTTTFGFSDTGSDRLPANTDVVTFTLVDD